MIIFKGKQQGISIQKYNNGNGINIDMIIVKLCVIITSIFIKSHVHFKEALVLFMDTIYKISDGNKYEIYLTESAVNDLSNRFKKHRDDLSTIIIRDENANNVQYVVNFGRIIMLLNKYNISIAPENHFNSE